MNRIASIILAIWIVSSNPAVAADGPIRILLVTGGCCHDYTFQTAQMKKALKKNGVAAKWTVVNEGGKGTKAQIKLYDDKDWAKNFDVVIHNECFANTTDEDYIRRITQSHKAGANAVVIHCAMHTYRAAKIDDWREFLGVTSRRHEHQSKYPVKIVATKHPIMQGFPKDYKTPKDELYVIEKLWPNTKVLASSVSEKDQKLYPVMWTNKYGKARVFGTTYGHSKDTFADEVFLNVLSRGIQWSAGRLTESAPK
jgi:type 1 glutamine amidotransferase